jgi:lysophospholipase L1-like esterase
MKRPTLVLVLVATLAASSYGLPFVRAGISHRLMRVENFLLFTPCGSYVADIPWTGRLQGEYAALTAYHDADLVLASSSPGTVIFLGDSITQRWAEQFPSEFFPGKGYINRGIGKQNTLQMILRFHQDVIELHPSVVVILAGTNDVAFRKAIDPHTERNIENMAVMAQRHGIRVILCSIPPLSDRNPAGQTYIDRLVPPFNESLRRYATEHHISFIDYYSALVDTTGEMPVSLSPDGVHPNLAGYAIMRPLAQRALDSKPIP